MISVLKHKRSFSPLVLFAPFRGSFLSVSPFAGHIEFSKLQQQAYRVQTLVSLIAAVRSLSEGLTPALARTVDRQNQPVSSSSDKRR